MFELSEAQERRVLASKVLIDKEGAVKLLDFGVAKLTGELAQTDLTSTLARKVGAICPETLPT